MIEQPGSYVVEIFSQVYGGDGLGRLPDGRAVFVPYVLPGEKVRIQVFDEKKSHARARLVEVLTPAPGRITPPCPHFGDCGGCHYQHLSYDNQLLLKRDILLDQLKRLANLPDPPVRPVVPSSRPWNYRNTVQFHLSPAGKIGYLAANSNRVVEIRECHLPEPVLNDTWPRLALEPLPGLEEIELRAGADDEVLLVLEGNDPRPPELEVDMRLSAVYLGPEQPYAMAGDDFVVMQVLGRPFKVSAGSFFQVNGPQAEAMVEHLLNILPLHPQSVVLDLYCGVGLFSAFLAPRVGRCIGVEVSPWACDDFAVNLDEFDNVDLYVGTTEEILPALQVSPDVVVLDPPRAGVEKAALQALLAMHPAVIAYVSCDPATLARDLRVLLSNGYTLEQVTPFDLFPQTYHIESISLLRAEP
jgi:23S rRNA (uracil1939-C5)-methyltransferase